MKKQTVYIAHSIADGDLPEKTQEFYFVSFKNGKDREVLFDYAKTWHSDGREVFPEFWLEPKQDMVVMSEWDFKAFANYCWLQAVGVQVRVERQEPRQNRAI